MSDLYRVVFEKNEHSLGLFGSRMAVPYASKRAFEELSVSSFMPDNKLALLAEGVTEQEAIKLVALTPEICTLMAAIENTKFSNLAEDFYLVKSAMVTAHRQILKNRDIIKTNCLLLSDASKYINAFKRMTVGAPLSLKVASQLSALKLLRNDQGQIKDYRPFVAYQ